MGIKVGTLTEFGNAIVQIAAKKNVEFAQELYNELVAATPVDTGFCRSEWRATVARPSTREFSYREPDKVILRQLGPFNFREQQIYFPTPFPLYKWKNYSNRWHNMYFTNNTDYIGELNEGKSKQAEPHFIENTVNDVISRFHNSLIPTISEMKYTDF